MENSETRAHETRHSGEKAGTSQTQHPTFLYTELGTKDVRLIVKNGYGCKDTAHESIEITSQEILFVPNAFSPNENGRNETFKPAELSAVNQFEMRIYNRWGQLIYFTDNTQNAWDGTYMGQPVPEGVYIYSIYAKFITGNIVSKSGNVHVLR